MTLFLIEKVLSVETFMGVQREQQRNVVSCVYVVCAVKMIG